MTDIEAVIQIRLALKARHIKTTNLNISQNCKQNCFKCLCGPVCDYIGESSSNHESWLENFEQFKSRVNLRQTLPQLQKLYPEYFI